MVLLVGGVSVIGGLLDGIYYRTAEKIFRIMVVVVIGIFVFWVFELCSLLDSHSVRYEVETQNVVDTTTHVLETIGEEYYLVQGSDSISCVYLDEEGLHTISVDSDDASIEISNSDVATVTIKTIMVTGRQYHWVAYANFEDISYTYEFVVPEGATKMQSTTSTETGL